MYSALQHCIPNSCERNGKKLSTVNRPTPSCTKVGTGKRSSAFWGCASAWEARKSAALAIRRIRVFFKAGVAAARAAGHIANQALSRGGQISWPLAKT